MSEYSAPWRHPEYRRGAREMVGISLGIAAWGLVTGVAMIKSGMGLGLALSRQTVLDHGGDMWAESSAEGGARFVIRLPLARSRDGVEEPALRLRG